MTLSNSQFSVLQKSRACHKGINILRFFKRAQRAYLYECVIAQFANKLQSKRTKKLTEHFTCFQQSFFDQDFEQA